MEYWRPPTKTTLSKLDLPLQSYTFLATPPPPLILEFFTPIHCLRAFQLPFEAKNMKILYTHESYTKHYSK